MVRRGSISPRGQGGRRGAFLAFFSERKRFLLKAGVALGVMLSAGTYTTDRYTLGFDPQDNRCLADYRSFVVDHKNHVVKRNDLVAFHAQGIEPIFDDGTLLAKYVRAVPGDIVEITENREVKVNGEIIEKGLRYAETIGKSPEDFVGTLEIPEGEFWVMGDTEYSFDSRYWGTVKVEQISGRAHGLL